MLMLNVNCSSLSGKMSPRMVMLKLAISEPFGIVSSEFDTPIKSVSSIDTHTLYESLLTKSLRLIVTA